MPSFSPNFFKTDSSGSLLNVQCYRLLRVDAAVEQNGGALRLGKTCHGRPQRFARPRYGRFFSEVAAETMHR